MLLNILAWWKRQGPARSDPERVRYYLWQLTRIAMTSQHISIDPRGRWSPIQARKVMEIINPQALFYGVRFETVDVTIHGDPGVRVILLAYCLVHDIAVMPEEICHECLRISRTAHR